MSDRQAVEALYAHIESELAAGKTAQQVEAELMERGLDLETAVSVVHDVESGSGPEVHHPGRHNMVVGALWCIGGILVTAFTYSAAQGGGTYVVAWGAIIFGAIQFFQGLAQS